MLNQYFVGSVGFSFFCLFCSSSGAVGAVRSATSARSTGRSATSQPCGPVCTRPWLVLCRGAPVAQWTWSATSLRLHRACGPFTPANRLPGRGGERFDELLDAIARGRARLAWLATSLIGRYLTGGGLPLLGQTHPKGALHRADVGHLAALQPVEEIGMIPVAGVGHHDLDRYAPGDGLIEQAQGNLRLGAVADRAGHMGPLSASGIGSPGFGQGELDGSGASGTGNCWPLRRPGIPH